MGILCKFIKQVGPNLKQVGLLLVEFQKIVPNKWVGWKICYLLEWKKCKNDNREYLFIWHSRVLNRLVSWFKCMDLACWVLQDCKQFGFTFQSKYFSTFSSILLHSTYENFSSLFLQIKLLVWFLSFGQGVEWQI